MDKASALRQAKLHYLKTTSGIDAHPVFWSPFIQLGDSKPIYLKTKGSWYPWRIGIAVILFFAGFFALRRR